MKNPLLSKYKQAAKEFVPKFILFVTCLTTRSTTSLAVVAEVRLMTTEVPLDRPHS